MLKLRINGSYRKTIDSEHTVKSLPTRKRFLPKVGMTSHHYKLRRSKLAVKTANLLRLLVEKKSHFERSEKPLAIPLKISPLVERKVRIKKYRKSFDYKLNGSTNFNPSIFLKSLVFRVINIKSYTRAVAAIIASGSLIL